MAKIATSLVLFSHVTFLPVSVSATHDSVDAADDQAACEMQTSLLQTKTEMRDTKLHHIHGSTKKSKMLVAFAEAKANQQNQHLQQQRHLKTLVAFAVANQHSDGAKLAAHTNKSHLLAAVAEAKAKVAKATVAKAKVAKAKFAKAKVAKVHRSDKAHVSRQEACPIADETDDNTVIASLVPNNGLVCYEGTKRELDQAYCLLQTSPTRALYRAGDSPWFQGDEVPADVEVELGSCGSREYDNLLHNPDDCWAPVQKWIRSGERGDEDFGGWEVAQGENWANYDEYYGIEEGSMQVGLFLSGCICLPDTDVHDVMQEICEDVDLSDFPPVRSEDEDEDDGGGGEHEDEDEDDEDDEGEDEANHPPARVARLAACAIADETDDNTAIASLVPNNGLVCYEGTKRELDQAYCFLLTAPTRGLYRAGDSPWFEGDEVPADVEVELGSCGSREYDNLLHNPDDCWAPVQKWIRSGERGDEDFGGWEVAQAENWANYDRHFDVEDEPISPGLLLSGCICLQGTDVMDAMHEICDEIDQEGYLPIA